MTDYRSDGAPSTADRIVAGLGTVNAKVDEMRSNMEQDPDSMGDKILKAALPSIAGLVAGKLFQLIWDHGTAEHSRNGNDNSFMMSVLFAGLSAAVGAVVAQLSGRGSQALVDRRHAKRR